MSRSRRATLTGLAFLIAHRIRDISRPYIERDEPVPRDLLAREFQDICRDYKPRGGALTTEEIAIVAEKWLPRAIRQLDQREQSQKEGFQKCN
jgi:hypothetical protein